MKSLLCIVFLAAALAFAGAQKANAQRCEITDPTGTPLNVRSAPNGRIVGQIRNGAIVHIVDNATDRKGRAWARIETERRRRFVVLGWVFREFISCF
jgi:hypothetical protein